MSSIGPTLKWKYDINYPRGMGGGGGAYIDSCINTVLNPLDDHTSSINRGPTMYVTICITIVVNYSPKLVPPPEVQPKNYYFASYSLVPANYLQILPSGAQRSGTEPPSPIPQQELLHDEENLLND